MPAYPIAVFHRLDTTTVASPRTKAVSSTTPPAPLHQELTQTSFADGLVGWAAVGNGNNYLHQTLSQAGIDASVHGYDKQRWLHLTVRYGAATMSQSLGMCPSPGLQELRIRYRTSASATLGVLVFSAAQAAPLGNLSLPTTNERWVTTSVPFVLAPTLVVAARSVPLTDCQFELSAEPAVAGMLSSADIASLSLTAAVPTVSATVADTTQPNGHWDSPTSPLAVHMTPTGDSTTLTVPADRHARLVVFWQRYDPGWVAHAGGGTTLHHVEVDGWANGFIVPSTDRDVPIAIAYTPQSLTVDGFFMVLAGLALLLAGGAFTMIRWRPRALRARIH